MWAVSAATTCVDTAAVTSCRKPSRPEAAPAIAGILEIAPIVDRSAVAARQLASRARRRGQGRAPNADHDVRHQRQVIDAFMAAAQEGDFERLVAVLDPDIVLRADGGAHAGLSRVVRGASAVAAQAATFSRSGLSNQLVLVNGQIAVENEKPTDKLAGRAIRHPVNQPSK